MTINTHLARHGKLFRDVVTEVLEPLTAEDLRRLARPGVDTTLKRYEAIANRALDQLPVDSKTMRKYTLHKKGLIANAMPPLRYVNDDLDTRLYDPQTLGLSHIQCDAMDVLISARALRQMLAEQHPVKLLLRVCIKYAMRLGFLVARLEAETAIETSDKSRSRKATKARTTSVETRRDCLVEFAHKHGWMKGHALPNEKLRSLFDELRTAHTEYTAVTDRTFHRDARARGLK